MKIRMKIPVAGTFHNLTGGVKVGDVVDLDDENGARYCALGYAEPVVDKREERAVAPKGEERSPTPQKASPAKAAAKTTEK